MNMLRKDLYQQHQRLWPFLSVSYYPWKQCCMYLRSWTCFRKTCIRNAPKPTVPSESVGTSLGIPLSQIYIITQVKESKIVHALLDVYWASWSGLGHGIIGGSEEAKMVLKEPDASCLYKGSSSSVQNMFEWSLFPNSSHPLIIHVIKLKWITLNWWGTRESNFRISTTQ